MNTTGHLIILTPEQLQRVVECALRTVLSEKAQTAPIEECDAPLMPRQAARYLNVSLSTLYRYTSQRLIPHHKPGKILYFYREELDAWLQGHRKLTRKEIAAGAELLPPRSQKVPVVAIKQKGRKAS